MRSACVCRVRVLVWGIRICVGSGHAWDDIWGQGVCEVRMCTGSGHVCGVSMCGVRACMGLGHIRGQDTYGIKTCVGSGHGVRTHVGSGRVGSAHPTFPSSPPPSPWMRVTPPPHSEKRRATIPPHLAYGRRGSPPTIPGERCPPAPPHTPPPPLIPHLHLCPAGDAVLRFEVQLVALSRAGGWRRALDRLLPLLCLALLPALLGLIGFHLYRKAGGPKASKKRQKEEKRNKAKKK